MGYLPAHPPTHTHTHSEFHRRTQIDRHGISQARWTVCACVCVRWRGKPNCGKRLLSLFTAVTCVPYQSAVTMSLMRVVTCCTSAWLFRSDDCRTSHDTASLLNPFLSRQSSLLFLLLVFEQLRCAFSRCGVVGEHLRRDRLPSVGKPLQLHSSHDSRARTTKDAAQHRGSLRQR
jgi:hypothetical protein